MNFADRIKQEARENKSADPGVKTITREEFVHAIDLVAKEEREQDMAPGVAAAGIRNGFDFMYLVETRLFDSGSTCTEDEFHYASVCVFEEMHQLLAGTEAVLRPVAGAIFANKVRKTLFHKEDR